jgi:hypothetical protein
MQTLAISNGDQCLLASRYRINAFPRVVLSDDTFAVSIIIFSASGVIHLSLHEQAGAGVSGNKFNPIWVSTVALDTECSPPVTPVFWVVGSDSICFSPTDFLIQFAYATYTMRFSIDQLSYAFGGF